MGGNKINLLSYNITYGNRFNNDRVDSIKIHYSSNFETKKRIKVYLGDYIFNTESQHQTIEVHKGTYWSTFSSVGSHSVNNDKHSLIVCSHPSPLSCSRKLKQFPAFKEINTFMIINMILKQERAILW